MQAFSFSKAPLEPERYRDSLADAGSGGYASFEGWVRDHNEGKHVRHLEYEAFESLAIKEGARIVQEAIERFGVNQAACVHRLGDLAIGELAVWVGVSSAHRAEAFAACRYIIDEVKHRVPIWKKEHYTDGDSGWVNCERCARAGPRSRAPARRSRASRARGTGFPGFRSRLLAPERAPRGRSDRAGEDPRRLGAGRRRGRPRRTGPAVPRRRRHRPDRHRRRRLRGGQQPAPPAAIRHR